jgi:hypothetical protein
MAVLNRQNLSAALIPFILPPVRIVWNWRTNKGNLRKREETCGLCVYRMHTEIAKIRPTWVCCLERRVPLIRTLEASAKPRDPYSTVRDTFTTNSQLHTQLQRSTRHQAD